MCLLSNRSDVCSCAASRSATQMNLESTHGVDEDNNGTNAMWYGSAGRRQCHFSTLACRSHEPVKWKTKAPRRRVWILWDYEQQRQCKMKTKEVEQKKKNTKNWCKNNTHSDTHRTNVDGTSGESLHVGRPSWNDVTTTMCTDKTAVTDEFQV